VGEEHGAGQASRPGSDDDDLAFHGDDSWFDSVGLRCTPSV
jgi:hypothetical protein